MTLKRNTKYIYFLFLEIYFYSISKQFKNIKKITLITIIFWTWEQTYVSHSL
ncbi:hypothetical protein NC653_025086 [Populus alba x Populus x berolinensis]|uniref:Uncharacterized protein n=1 Tax=Populus alba x Populus x berolinensis TaxID=444605 RepID=A0AAD6MAD0_9ROSI|nr:hypothetical protein NC653_025086 [Populus alba x Populus x berolinensis]